MSSQLERPRCPRSDRADAKAARDRRAGARAVVELPRSADPARALPGAGQRGDRASERRRGRGRRHRRGRPPVRCRRSRRGDLLSALDGRPVRARTGHRAVRLHARRHARRSRGGRRAGARRHPVTSFVRGGGDAPVRGRDGVVFADRAATCPCRRERAHDRHRRRCALRAAVREGPRRGVVAVTSSPAKAELLARHGADSVVDPARTTTGSTSSTSSPTAAASTTWSRQAPSTRCRGHLRVAQTTVMSPWSPSSARDRSIAER